MLGQFLHGIGAAPLYTLGVTFLDENVKQKWSSIYLGELECSYIFVETTKNASYVTFVMNMHPTLKDYQTFRPS